MGTDWRVGDRVVGRSAPRMKVWVVTGVRALPSGRGQLLDVEAEDPDARKKAQRQRTYAGDAVKRAEDNP